MATESKTDRQDDQSTISCWPLNDEWTEDGKQKRQAKNDYSGELVEWQRGKPETAVRRRMDGTVVCEEGGRNRARLVAEAHERQKSRP